MPIINIVLVEPEIPQNTGNIARTCAATGARLHIIKPMGFTIDDKKLKRSGLDYWEYLDITYYENLDDFCIKNPNAISFYFTTKARHVYSDVTFPDNCFLFFGKETKGLPEELLLANPESCLRFPMQTGIRSLNLANTVCAAVYEVLRQWNFPTLQNYGQLHNYKWPE